LAVDQLFRQISTTYANAGALTPEDQAKVDFATEMGEVLRREPLWQHMRHDELGDAAESAVGLVRRWGLNIEN
jgi:hypothetical protein